MLEEGIKQNKKNQSSNQLLNKNVVLTVAVYCAITPTNLRIVKKSIAQWEPTLLQYN